ncbi:MAG: amino acid adenylation domain-containing protein, partial [Bacteroidota bacterium]
LRDNPSFLDFVQQVKSTTLEAYHYQDTPFEKVVDRIVKDRDISMNPLSQVMFVLQNAPKEIRLGQASETLSIDHLSEMQFEFTGIENSYRISKFDLTINVFEFDDRIGFDIEYCTELFKPTTIERMGRHYESLLKAIVQNPASRLDDFNLLDQAEQQEILTSFNPAATSYPAEKTVIDLFAEQAIRVPDNVALVFEESQLTYRELDARSNALAHYLRQHGVKEESLVSISMDRSVELLIGILGIIKAGGVYVPLDPSYPQDRIDYVVQDSGLKLVLTKSKFETLFSHLALQCISIDRAAEAIANCSTEKLETNLKPTNAIYVIYTSGSTGRPKGVVIEHRNVVRLFKTEKALFDFKETDVWTLFHSYCFDFSVWEMYGALLFGGQLVIPTEEVVRDAALYCALLAKEGVTILNQTPGSFYVIQDYYLSNYKSSNLRYVIFGGEALAPKRLLAWKKAYPGCRLINMYGITETTVHVTYKEIGDAEIEAGISNIGQAIPTLQCYILDGKGNVLPKGIIGEIYVGGLGLGRGYLNRPELTAERFVEYSLGGQLRRLYKTGDLGQWLEDGTIAYCGRQDDQVKIRAYRIELGEVEFALESSPLVKQAVVLAKADVHGEQRLVAYLVPNGNFDKMGIQQYLSRKLPKYMIPTILVPLTAFPLTVNGKLDKASLPEPELGGNTESDSPAPRNAIERQLVPIWERLLGVEGIGIQDDFFELGGHSLLATRVVSAIKKELGLSLGAQEVFLNPTIAELAEVMSELEVEDSLPKLSRVDARPARIPLSYAQERLWFIDQLTGSVQYHIPFVEDFGSALNVAALEAALEAVVRRHEVLRTVIREVDGKPYQVVLSENNWRMEQTVLKQEDSLDAILAEYLHKPFDLSNDSMLRVQLIALQEGRYKLLIVLHHIAGDGWSLNILFNEVLTLYRAKLEGKTADLPQLDIQYADYAIWQRRHLVGDLLESKLAYWKAKLKGGELLNLPLDFSRPAIQSIKGKSFQSTIDAALAERLRAICLEEGVTLYMLLLTAFKTMLYKYVPHADICVGSSVANRHQKELENSIGCFVGLIALRSDLSGNPRFNDLLQEVKRNTLDATEHYDAPFEKVVDQIIEDRDR